MTLEKFTLLVAYIDSAIALKIEDAFGRDALNESIRASTLKEELQRELVQS